MPIASGIRGLIAVCVFFCAAPLNGYAETKTTKSISYFKIGGRTAEDLDRELQNRGPLTRGTGARHPGATEIKFGGDVTYAESKGRCKISSVNVTLHTRLLLPQWKNRRRASKDLALIWDTLAADIKRHEERHAEIARNHARILDQKLSSLPAMKDCESLQARVAQTTRDVIDAHDRDQLRFDRIESKNFDDRIMRLLQYRLQQSLPK